MSAALVDVRAGWDRAHAEDLDALTPAEVEARLHELRAVQAAAQAYEAKLCARYDPDREWARHGALSAAAYVAKTHRLPIEACRKPFTDARHLRHLPAVMEALAAGSIEGPHVQRILRADNPRVHDALVADQVTIVRWAMQLAWPLFVRRLQDWIEEHDPDGPEPTDADRSFTCSRTIDDRWVLDGILDPVAGSVFDRELRRLEHLVFKQDWQQAEDRLGREPLPHELARTPTQRRADALVLMAERSATLPEDSRREHRCSWSSSATSPS